MYSYRLYRSDNICTIVSGITTLDAAVQEVRDRIAAGKGTRGVISRRCATWSAPTVMGTVNEKGEYENKL